jgi:mannose-6-phosphate isomerase-like protein (cupin superfamily)
MVDQFEVSGASLTICLMHQIEKFRIKERIRLYYRDVLLRMEEGEDNESINEEKKNRNFPQSYSYGDSSKVQVLVSSTNMITSNLCCAKVTLKPRTGITQRRSEAVECYYVLSGRGLFIQECDDESNKCFESDMARDEVMVVEPWK